MAEEILIVVAIVLALSAAYAIAVFNDLVRLRNGVGKAWSNIDVLLKQRYDEIPNVVRAVKGYMKHEKGALEAITRLRATAAKERGVGRLAAENELISESLKSIFALAEDYPELKADRGFLKLQTRLSELENEISDRREFYNDMATNFNTRIGSFPDILVSRAIGMKAIELFRASAQEKEAAGWR